MIAAAADTPPPARLSSLLSMYRPVRVTCRAPHPDPSRPTARCGTVIGYVPGPIRFDAVVARMPEEGDGHVYLPCPRKNCGAVNRFAVLEPSALGDGEGEGEDAAA